MQILEKGLDHRPIPRRAGRDRDSVPKPPTSLQRRLLRYLRNAVGLCVTVVFLYPVLLTLATALRKAADVAASPLGLPVHPTFANITAAFRDMNFARSVGNTLLITAAATVIVVMLGSLAAYPLARITATWSKWTHRLFLAGMAIPLFVGIAPLYITLRSMGLVNTIGGVILIEAGVNLPLAVFFYTGFLRSLPQELEEAAAIDGCGPLRTFLSTVLPLLRPVTGTLIMFVTLAVWNDLAVPLVFLQNPQQWTVMVNAYSYIGPHGFEPTTLFATAFLGTLPLLVGFVFLQRLITEGITAGAVKG
jgi:raffinose/stachyose/melibiose transport system permease protein